MALVILEEWVGVEEIISIAVAVVLQLIRVVIIVVLIYFTGFKLLRGCRSDRFAKNLEVAHLTVCEHASFICQMASNTQA
jgi:hypothetical protein